MGRHRRSTTGPTPGGDGSPQGAPDPWFGRGTPDPAAHPSPDDPAGVARPYVPQPDDGGPATARGDHPDPAGYGGTDHHRYDAVYGGSSAYGRGLAGYAGSGSGSAADGFPDLSAPDVFWAEAARPEPEPVEPVTAALPLVPGPEGRSAARRKPRGRVSAPVRTGLLGVSAAVALGAVAVAAGVLPNGDATKVNDAADRVRTSETPNGVASNGGTSATPTPSEAVPAPPSAPMKPTTDPGKQGGADREHREAAKPSQAPTEPAAPTAKEPAPQRTTPAERPTTAPATPPKPSAPAPKPAPSTPVAPPPAAEVPTGGTAEAQVLALVNQERAKVGCQPLGADDELARLAEGFSRDMAARGFFDHTDPDGDSPWDRAAAAGIDGLGGENIARGQADAAAVMDAWMNSPGHRANILNCDFKTLGVGAHFASGGPWWTQNFGY
ncbi:CAP domain-containing protein [Streptomyces sp. NPDC049906]|uniref:CAP domain-containing protein n=1 Tax=Streptomyces sp. NPDC049906 TaxID=3155656 RepID=UPI00342AC002